MVEDDAGIARLLEIELDEAGYALARRGDRRGRPGGDGQPTTRTSSCSTCGCPTSTGARSAAARGAPAIRCPSSCSPRSTASAIACWDWTPAPTTTWPSRSPSRSCSPGCGPCLRRSGSSDDWLEVGEVRLNPATREVQVDGAPVELSAREFDLLAFLMHAPGRVFTREQIYEGVWGYSFMGQTKVIDVFISALRTPPGVDAENGRSSGRCGAWATPRGREPDRWRPRAVRRGRARHHPAAPHGVVPAGHGGAGRGGLDRDLPHRARPAARRRRSSAALVLARAAAVGGGAGRGRARSARRARATASGSSMPPGASLAGTTGATETTRGAGRRDHRAHSTGTSPRPPPGRRRRGGRGAVDRRPRLHPVARCGSTLVARRPRRPAGVGGPRRGSSPRAPCGRSTGCAARWTRSPGRRWAAACPTGPPDELGLLAARLQPPARARRGGGARAGELRRRRLPRAQDADHRDRGPRPRGRSARIDRSDLPQARESAEIVLQRVAPAGRHARRAAGAGRGRRDVPEAPGAGAPRPRRRGGLQRDRAPHAPDRRLDVRLEEATVAADHGRLRELALILIDNAVKYSPARRAITVSVSARPAPADGARPRARVVGGGRGAGLRPLLPRLGVGGEPGKRPRARDRPGHLPPVRRPRDARPGPDGGTGAVVAFPEDAG